MRAERERTTQTPLSAVIIAGGKRSFAHRRELRAEASAALRHRYLPVPNPAKDTAPETTAADRQDTYKPQCKKYQRLHANLTVLTQNDKRRSNPQLAAALEDQLVSREPQARPKVSLL